jgi:hypothetical protein
MRREGERGSERCHQWKLKLAAEKRSGAFLKLHPIHRLVVAGLSLECQVNSPAPLLLPFISSPLRDDAIYCMVVQNTLC